MHRIKSSSLFHPKKHNGRTPSSPSPSPPPSPSLVEAELPKPASTLGLSTPKALPFGGRVMFMPYGSSRDKIVSADQDGTVLVHDLYHNMVSGMPRLKQGWTPNSIAITLGEDLYLIDRCPHERDHIQMSYEPPCFQALIHGEPPADVKWFPGWHWHSLPLPPYVEASGYKPRCDYKIASSTVVGDSIWVSARGGIGTYSFDRGSREWSKVGSWELPFRGEAEYVPELGRWLGFSPGRENQFLCASDLSPAAAAADGAAAAPTLCRVWEDDDIATTPQDWVLLGSDLVRVDSCRLCVARHFQVYDEDLSMRENFAVLTGVELERGDAADGGIQMVKHKSIRYNFDLRMVLLLVC